MNVDEFKKNYIRDELGIDNSFGRIFIAIDFGNVNYWFNKDRQDTNNNPLAEDEEFCIDITKLEDFCSIFSDHVRFYYGHDPANLAFITAVRHKFGKTRVFTKPIQKIRHHISEEETAVSTRVIHKDPEGMFVFIPKCNFDVEITVDMIRLMKNYDTLMLFSSDADFVSLNRFLRKNGKKVILLKGGNITTSLRQNSDMVINAQMIKRHIALIKKQKPGG